MKIKYNRFAVLPHTCCNCGKSFWLEPYKHSTYDRFSPVGGFSIVDINLCKVCSDSVESEDKE